MTVLLISEDVTLWVLVTATSVFYSLLYFGLFLSLKFLEEKHLFKIQYFPV